MISRIEELMEHETAGDPMTGLKWTRRTTEKLAEELASMGIQVCPRTVARLLKEMDFSLRANHKTIERGSSVSPEERDAQFAHISDLRKRCVARGIPLISVDTKKKELVGLFKNAGVTWQQAPVRVNDHDFRSDAKGIAIPYGVYDLQANRGMIAVGTSYDTSEFAVDTIELWWRTEGSPRYPQATELVILADGGGSNGATRRAWKYELQQKLCNRHGLTVTVSHYPPGASKYNPIEHRLFSEISKHWAGRPLDSYETILNYLRTTTTKTGLQVKAHLVPVTYEKGIKITDAQMDELAISKDKAMPKRNYTLRPTSVVADGCERHAAA